MSYPPVTADATAATRLACERRDPAATASVHNCASCGRAVPWRALRWLVFEGLSAPVPVHDCDKYPLPKEAASV